MPFNEVLVVERASTVVNTPPFDPENNIDVNATDMGVHYDHELFLGLTHGLKQYGR